MLGTWGGLISLYEGILAQPRGGAEGTRTWHLPRIMETARVFPMVDIYCRKVIRPLLATLQGLHEGRLRLVILHRLLRFLVPDTLYIVYMACGTMQLWYGTARDIPAHLYTCPLVERSQAQDTSVPQICQEDTWVAACTWGTYLFAATSAGTVVRTEHAGKGGRVQCWARTEYDILEMQVATERLWVCTKDGTVRSYDRDLQLMAAIHPRNRWHNAWPWTMAVGMVPYISHGGTVRVYSWNSELDRPFSWVMPPEVTDYASPYGGVRSLKHCWTAMGKSLLVSALSDSYQIWDVRTVGSPGHLLRHQRLLHQLRHIAIAWNHDDGEPGQAGGIRLLQSTQEGCFVCSGKVYERHWGGVGVVEHDRCLLTRDACLQCFRYNGQWITTSVGRIPPGPCVKMQINVDRDEDGWAPSHGIGAKVIGFQGWSLDAHDEARAGAAVWREILGVLGHSPA